MADEELEGLSESEQQVLAEYEAEGEIPVGEAEGEGEPAVVALEAEEEKPESIRVPLGELKEERRKRQDAEQRLNVLMERTNTLLGQIQQVTTPGPEEPPSKEEDPVGYLIWQNEQLQQRLQVNEQRGQEYIQTQAQEQEAVRFWNDYNNSINEYAAKVPDYKAAAEFLVGSRRQELNAMGVTDPEQQDQILWQDSFAIAAQSRNMGRNHAEIFYEMAKLRGYQPSAAATTNAPSPSSPRKDMGNIRRGQQAAASLSNVGGAGGEVELSAEALIGMTEEEFAAATQGRKWRRLHGG